MGDYEISEVRQGWKADGIRYRRIITTSGQTVIEKGLNGMYVADYVADAEE